jgi:hypothetical protein
MRRALTILGLVTIVAGAAWPVVAAELQPLMAGWERVFTIDWQAGTYRGQPAVEGYVKNISPYHLTRIQIMVESLDAGGQVTNQKVAWLSGDVLGGGRMFFQVPTAAAPSYRVRVFSYDRGEFDSNFR